MFPVIKKVFVSKKIFQCCFPYLVTQPDPITRVTSIKDLFKESKLTQSFDKVAYFYNL